MNFFQWYNTEHHHSALGLLTPEDVHYGRGPRIVEARQEVLNIAYTEHPERFVSKRPQAPQLPEAVWINPPALNAEKEKPECDKTPCTMLT